MNPRRAQAARPRRQLLGRALLMSVLALVLLAAPAQAHTALQGSAPAAGERLAYPPDEVILTFAAPVDPATLTVTLRDGDGNPVELVPPPPDEAQITTAAYDVPDLAQGVYGLTWESVGDDGHRARGEILFGVGAAPSGATVAGGPTDPVAAALDVAAAVARVLWYLALAAVAAVAVLRSAGRSALAAAVTSRRGVVIAALAAAALLRATVGAVIVIQAGGGMGRALQARSTLLWLGVALTLLLVGALLGRGPQPGRWWPRAVPSGRSLDWGLFGIAVLVGTLAGHAPGRPDPLLAVTFGVAHLGAAAVWVGPLLGVLAATRTAAWRDLGLIARRDHMRCTMRAVVPAATGALVVVLLSGGMLALRTWDGAGLPSGTWAWVLIAKALVVVAVVLPLGWVHHRRAGMSMGEARLREEPVGMSVVGAGRSPAEDSERLSALPRTYRVEIAGLLAAVVLGSVLVGVDPGWGGSPTGTSDDALVALLDGGVDDPADCADLDVGRAACYRSSLTAMMSEQGPQAAIDTIGVLSETDDYVSSNCHQVAHDLGNDASVQIADMAEALAVEGSVCWSGYYHGFVEARLSAIDDAELIEGLPSFCDGAADPRYSFTHYNCVHGLGHGLMLRVDSALFDALPLCEELDEHWTTRSCASGVFMENVMAAQQGEQVEGLRDDDLLYPCNVIEGPLVEDCYLMQTSHILYKLNGDLTGAFQWCDQAPSEYIATCYRSMGRDISGRSLLDVEQIVEGCRLGRADMSPWCFDGAASNAVYDTAATERADALCAVLTGEEQQRCTAARDQAVSTVAAG